MAQAPGYYLLECEEPLSPDGEALLEIHNTFRVGEIRLWKSGKRHTRPVPEPIEVRFETFTSLVLDEAACGGRLLFRLAESVNALAVAATVRAHLLAAGFDTLRFREPGDWVQL